MVEDIHKTTIPEIHRILKSGGCFAILSMIGLPRESTILAKSDEALKQMAGDVFKIPHQIIMNIYRVKK